MKIALISPPALKFGIKLRTGPYHAFPIGLGCLAAYVQRAGHTVKIIAPDPAGMDMETAWKLLREFKPDIVGISSVTQTFLTSGRLAQEAKRRLGCPVIMGGIHVTALPRTSLLRFPELDAVIRGEGELPLLALADGFDKTGRIDFANVPGASFIRNGEYTENPMPDSISDLDSLPYFARDLLEGGIYQKHTPTDKPLSHMAMISSRGCPASCTFCANSRMGRRFRARSAENVVGEMEYCIKRYGTEYFVFYDDCFTTDPRRVYAICELLIAKKLKIYWEASTRVNMLLDEELLKKMKRAGCKGITIGVETGDQHISDLMKKGTTPVQAELCTALLRKYNIPFSAGFMIGNEGDTPETVRKTIAFACKLKPTIAFFSITIPMPGTELFEKYYADFDRLDTDWSRWTAQGISRPFDLRHTAISPKKLFLLFVWAHLRFYLNPLQFLRMTMDLASNER